MSFYSIDKKVNPFIVNEYKKSLTRIILKDYLIFLPVFAFILCIFCFTDFYVRGFAIKNILVARAAPIGFAIVLIVIKISRFEKYDKLILALNNLLAFSTLFMGVFMMFSTIYTPLFKTAIIAVVIFSFVSMFFVKGIRSIIFVYGLCLLSVFFYVFIILKPELNYLADLMNPLAIYVSIIVIAIRQEKLRFQRFHLEHCLNDEKLKVQELYNDTLAQNEELTSLNDNLLAARENLQAANRIKDRMFSVISHDLRSPFSVLIGFAELLIKNPENFSEERKTKVYNELHKVSTNTLNLLENLLKWSLSQSNAIDINMSTYNVNTLILEVLTSIEPMAAQKKVKIQSEINHNQNIFIDKELFGIALRNILANAIKFSFKEGEIVINSKIKSSKINIVVCDQGIGISEDRLKVLFDSCVSSSTLGTENERGTGLGLNLAKEFIEKIGGEIQVKSKLGKGTCVTLSFNLNNE